MGSGMYGALGVVSALYHREKTGRGQHIEGDAAGHPNLLADLARR